MSKNLILSYKKKYQENGTIMIPFTEEINPINQEDFNHLLSYCEKVDKEFIEIGDAGETNNLMVGRFMTDKEKPIIVNNNFSLKLLEILNKDVVINLIKEILNLKNKIYYRRVQYNQINENNFVGYHLDTDSNPDYIAACVIQLGDDFDGGKYRVYQKDKSYRDFCPKKGSFIISNCNFPHEVTKVTKGQRKSLVFFISEHFGKNRRYS